jgi:hypothetical protein
MGLAFHCTARYIHRPSWWQAHADTWDQWQSQIAVPKEDSRRYTCDVAVERAGVWVVLLVQVHAAAR